MGRSDVRQRGVRSFAKERESERGEKTGINLELHEDREHGLDTALDVESPSKKHRAEGLSCDTDMQHVDEDELSNTQQGPEEGTAQNSVPLSQKETQPWRLDVAGDRDGTGFGPPVGLESGVPQMLPPYHKCLCLLKLQPLEEEPCSIHRSLQEEVRLERAPTDQTVAGEAGPDFEGC